MLQDINYKKLTLKGKVTLLENTILHGTIEDLKEVLEKAQPFEFTARALGFACAYGGKEMVDLLLEHHIHFAYQYDSIQKAKYQHVLHSSHLAQYMLFLAYTGVHVNIARLNTTTKMYHFGNLDQFTLPKKMLGQTERTEIALMLLQKQCKGFDAQILLYYSILWNNTELTNALTNLGITLFMPGDEKENNLHYNYYKALTSPKPTDKRSEFCDTLLSYSPEVVVEVLKTFDTQLKRCPLFYKMISFTPNVFEKENTPFQNSKVLKYMLEHTDTSRFTKTSLLELAINIESIASLEVMVEKGWLENIEVRDRLIAYASNQQKLSVLMWLLDYKNRTADFAKEEEEREKKKLKNFNTSPNSVAYLKKQWSFKVLENDTIMITGYKGVELDVVVPSKIGKRDVTIIGEEAFYLNPKYKRHRQYFDIPRLKTITIPEGITSIEFGAFKNCEYLTKIQLPESVTSIGEQAFIGCVNLETIKLPSNVSVIKYCTFRHCESLTHVDLPSNLKTIEYGSFIYCRSLKNISIPNNVCKIEGHVFGKCTNLESVSIPKSVTEMHNNVFDGCKSLRKIVIHNPFLSIEWLYLKRFPNLTIYAPETSVAQRYAKSHQIPFVSTELIKKSC